MNNSVIEFAKSELDKYLKLIGVSADIKLGLFEDFGIKTDVKNPFFDDAFEIKVENKKGYAAGVNGRSVLFAVYRLLEESGIRFLRPGKNGTYIPKDITLVDVDIREAASYSTRGIAIEGAVSLENVLDMVEWLPKRGFNCYFTQFRDSFVFFDRWYSHRESTTKEPEPFSREKALEYVDIIKFELKKRGLIHVAMGHGFTSDPFGVPGNSWDPVDPATFTDFFVENCAMVNGKRQVYKNIPMATQMCYSRPIVRSTIVKGAVDYLLENPEVGILDFCLGDAFHNLCECEDCAKLPLADYYNMILNELDEALTEKGINTRIYDELYLELLHPPKEVFLKNPDRFILAFAPISRTYCESLPDTYRVKEIPPYVLNSFEMPLNIDDNLAYLYKYKELWRGPIDLMDYHLMWDYILDAGAESISNIIYQDVRNMEKLGMSGFLSFQPGRNFFPNPLAMTVMGKTLWNKNEKIEDIKRFVYEASYGPEAVSKLEPYFRALSDAFDIGSLRSQKPFDKEVLRSKLTAAIDIMEEYKPYVAQQIESAEDPVRKEWWEFLQYHARLYILFGQSIIARIDNDTDKAKELYEASAQIAWENEDKLQPVLDSWMYEGMIRTRVKLDGRKTFAGV